MIKKWHFSIFWISVQLGIIAENTIEKTNVFLLSKTLLSISITNFYIMSFHSVLYMFIHIITQPDAIDNTLKMIFKT